jgi:hypothetical protein
MYCQSCGTPHEYTTKKPNFCQNCGFQFNASIAKNIPQESQKLTSRDEEDEYYDDEEESEDVVPDIKDLDIDIEVNPQRGYKIREIAGTASSSEGFEREREPRVSREEFLNSFKKEAGSMRPRRKSKNES